jgi:hypothetical protein
MNWYGKPEDDKDRRRWLHAYSRHEATRGHLIVELTESGTDYLAHEPPPEGQSIESWQVLCAVLNDAAQPLTQREILRDWPEDFARPNRTTIFEGPQERPGTRPDRPPGRGNETRSVSLLAAGSGGGIVRQERR